MSRNDYHKNWAVQIDKHRTLLLPQYHSEIDFPTPPYRPEEIVVYLEQVKPYLVKSRVARRWTVVLGLILFLAGFILPIIV